jgi:aromatic-amino-acid transaminase
VDLSQSQWRAVIEVLQSRALIPFIDLAYQGFGDGEEDASRRARWPRPA